MDILDKIWVIIILTICAQTVLAQCPILICESSDPDCSENCEVCLKDKINFRLTGDNMEHGSCIEWFIGPSDAEDLTEEIFIGCSNVTVECPNGPQFMYLDIDPQLGADKCDEFLAIYTGSTGFNAGDIKIKHTMADSIFQPYTLGNTNQFVLDCDLIPVGPDDFIPNDAILIMQSSVISTNKYGISSLCNLGLDIYVLGSSNTDCSGGFLINTRDTKYTIELDCIAESIFVPANSNAWSYIEGVGDWTNNVPKMQIPESSPGVTIIENFTFEVTQDIIEDLCETPSTNLNIQGYLNPQNNDCSQVSTEVYSVLLSCNQPNDIDDINKWLSSSNNTLDLTEYDDEISGLDGDIIWSNDEDGSDIILNPTNYPGSGPVYAAIDVDGCISNTTEININVLSASDCIFVPNIFTPDIAGPNSDMTIYICDIGIVNEFSVYDRWGNQIWSQQNYPTNDVNNKWEGRNMDGQAVESGVYVYYINVDIPRCDALIKTGNITVLR